MSFSEPSVVSEAKREVLVKNITLYKFKSLPPEADLSKFVDPKFVAKGIHATLLSGNPNSSPPLPSL